MQSRTAVIAGTFVRSAEDRESSHNEAHKDFASSRKQRTLARRRGTRRGAACILRTGKSEVDRPRHSRWLRVAGGGIITRQRWVTHELSASQRCRNEGRHLRH